MHRTNCIPNECTSFLWDAFGNEISTASEGLGVACVQSLSLLQLTRAVVLPSGTSLWSPAPLGCLSSRLCACQVQSLVLSSTNLLKCFLTVCLHMVPSVSSFLIRRKHRTDTVSSVISDFPAIAFVQHFQVTFLVKLCTLTFSESVLGDLSTSCFL